MKLIEQPPTDSTQFSDESVKGVELQGLDDAYDLVARLGAYANDVISAFPLSEAVTAERALDVQAQLLNEVKTNSIINDAPFVFRAVNRYGGNVLRSAANLTTGKWITIHTGDIANKDDWDSGINPIMEWSSKQFPLNYDPVNIKYSLDREHARQLPNNIN